MLSNGVNVFRIIVNNLRLSLGEALVVSGLADPAGL
jgi:hypothetical protein